MKRFQSRKPNGRFQRNTLKTVFGIPDSDVAACPMVCGKCGYGSGEKKWIPLMVYGQCKKCDNQEGHITLKEWEKQNLNTEVNKSES